MCAWLALRPSGLSTRPVEPVKPVCCSFPVTSVVLLVVTTEQDSPGHLPES